MGTDNWDKRQGKIQFCRATGLEVVMLYPVGGIRIEYTPDGHSPETGRQEALQLALTEDEARAFGQQFLRLADSIAAFGGSKQ